MLNSSTKRKELKLTKEKKENSQEIGGLKNKSEDSLLTNTLDLTPGK